MDLHLKQSVSALNARMPLPDKISLALIEYSIWFDNHGTNLTSPQAKHLVWKINTFKTKYPGFERYAAVSPGDLRDLSDAMEQLIRMV